MTDFNPNVLETFIKSFSCSDQNLEEFEHRVFSFIEGQKWVSRPLVLSPLICAQYGWKCVNPNLLECIACGAKLCTQEPKIEIYDAYKSCLDKIVADLKDGHKDDCPWPLAPSPESFVKMVPLPKEEALSQFVNRLKPFLNSDSSIPQVKGSIPSVLDLKQEDVCSIFKLAKVTSKYTNEIVMSAVCLAATGWTLFFKRNGEMMTYVRCDSCQRMIWVKSFNLVTDLSTEDAPNTKNGTNSRNKSFSNVVNRTSSEKESTSSVKYVTNSGNESSPDVDNNLNSERTNSKEKSTSNIENGANSEKESSHKRNSDTSNERPLKRVKLDKRDFDPLEEHRPWCRWVSNTDAKVFLKDNEKTPVIGWELYRKSLLRNIPNFRDNNSEATPTKEHFRSIQDLLDSWTSPSSL
ncbi:zinc finger C3HC-type protein 1-like isoform X1 [Parasteatoda tepidariorum]|uniref:zinc finger C3HC-type protein 1-like isoform X1 n=1 Tax=Parasteatoda tepidariorum TaxID=114398 RepID=UPI001C727614|nr:NIPA-like protein [Parasteatoda tepidariorum]